MNGAMLWMKLKKPNIGCHRRGTRESSRKSESAPSAPLNVPIENRVGALILLLIRHEAISLTLLQVSAKLIAFMDT